ncbi:hypothetical protein PF005_g22327 [Phytophthora fragariae]|uniref:Spindle pole body component n=1 Tax=Phytophthora fragariae TaxID=53985 RepID=A0A6A4D142_9STRA|nr:hypothetical protein PF009_g14954 [Phytophthora fragariae]KAE9107818.1 hypothetical protein PF007_g12897 [Phytophthora fragariae]KAE9182837.1 hypothetical protein PF005_g22327 [Phytophthora fragariae]KAE9194213.1 hypothetical protein PF004_g20779 [Phytophthora fragariae]KAE9196434.1 hypothetical protein PF002_g23054 [Phytophthora fragariae]
MAPVPSWTREWRPLARQLCAAVLDENQDDEEETQLLRADRVVGQLYAHRFADCLPQDAQSQAQAVATKFRVHSLEDRAEKLLQLSGRCDPQVLKLLLELASAPTAASDRDVAVDEDARSTWKTVLQQEQSRQQQLQLMQEQMADELFQISTNDEWYQAWDDSDEDDSDWDVDEDVVAEAPAAAGARRNGKRSSEVMEEVEEQEVTRVDGVWDEETRRDEVLCRYHPEVEVQGDDMAEEEEDPTCELEKRSLVPFTLERPWLLCEAVIAMGEGGLMSNGAVAPRRLIHERTVVRMVFEALDGVESLMFELRPVQPTPTIFSVDFQTKTVERSRRSLGVAVGHLSPLALQHMLEDFALAASELQFIRDLLGFIRQARDLSEQHRCVTLEGLANSLAGIVGIVNGTIRNVEQETCSTAVFDGENDGNPWSGMTARQPTLLGVFGGLKETFNMISWLKRILVRCFQGLSDRRWHEIRRAEQAKCVLDALYCMMEVEYVEGVIADEKASAAGNMSRSEVLLRLFVGALNPYLELINRMMFERGHFDTIPLDGELFFATPASISVNASPMRERNQSFREGLVSLAPFEVHRPLVPRFLEPVVDLMSEALASRQMKNRFLHHQQFTTEEPLAKPEQPRPSLYELLTRELEAMRCGFHDGTWSVSNALRRLGDEMSTSSNGILLECVPFNRILERCLTRQIEDKCQELNGEITDIFRDKMNYMEHVEALRMFVLMEQQDVFNVFSEMLVAHMQENPVAWADSEKINVFHQSAVQGVFEDNSLSSSQRQIGGRLCVRVDFNRLDSATGGAKIDIATMKCLHFTFAVQQPLRVLFSASIMQKYSRLGVFLVQVKAVESALVKFKSTLRHRRCYSFIEADMRQLLIQIADMLHYTKSILNYLTSQVSSEGWSKHCRTLRSSRSLAEMDATHEQYLDHMLNRFFLLDKHAAVVQYILTTFNHILRFVGHVDDFVSAVDRNMRKYFPTNWSDDDEDTETRSSNEFKRQSHFLVVMLTAMQKHGASPHVNEIVTQLNYNYFYHQQENRSRV